MSSGPLVLCADDDEDILALLSFCLERAGFRVEQVSDGEAALAAVRELRPQVVVLDVMMPRRNGLEVLAELRADPGLADVRVLLLSAGVQEADVGRGVAAGANAYLAKPFRSQELVAAVRRLATE